MPSIPSDTHLHLEEVTQETIEAALALRVLPSQEQFVESVAHSLAEAYVYPQAWPRLIFDGEQLVGFVMGFFDVGWKEDDPSDVRSGIWRLNIAADRQGSGYGRFAVEAICSEIRRRDGDKAYVTWEPAEGGPEAFYLKLGFQPTGETSDGQTVGVLAL